MAPACPDTNKLSEPANLGSREPANRDEQSRSNHLPRSGSQRFGRLSVGLQAIILPLKVEMQKAKGRMKQGKKG